MSFSKFWNNAIWRLLRPTYITQSVVSAVRMATNRLSTLDNLTSNKATIATGKQYLIVSVPLTAITEIDREELDGSIVKVNLIAGLPTGAVTIGKSPDGLTAVRYAHFTETDNGYIFWEPPTKYGVVSSRGGDHVTFCVCVGSPSYVDDQDTAGVFCQALSDSTVARMATTMTKTQAVNGLSGDVLALACGTTCSVSDATVATYWTEGDDLYALADGQLLVARGKADVKPEHHLAAGDALVPLTTDFVVVADDYNKTATWLDSACLGSTLPAFVLEIAPELTHINDIKLASDFIRSKDSFTYETTNSPDDPGTQRLLRKYKTTAPYMHLVQRLELSTTAALDDVDSIIVICADSINSGITPEVSESALSYMLRCARAGAVAVINDLYKQGDALYGITLYSDTVTKPIAAGMYIQSVMLVHREKNGSPGAILDEMRVKPTTVKSGEVIAIKVANSKE